MPTNYCLRANKKSKTHQESAVRKGTILANNVSRPQVSEERSAEKDATEMEVICGCPRLEMLHDAKSCAPVEACRSPKQAEREVDKT